MKSKTKLILFFIIGLVEQLCAVGLIIIALTDIVHAFLIQMLLCLIMLIFVFLLFVILFWKEPQEISPNKPKEIQPITELIESDTPPQQSDKGANK